MSASTALIGPYDNLRTHEKIRAHVGLPLALHEHYFKTFFPYRGSQDKILARLFHLFINHLETLHPNFNEYTNQQREYHANELLNRLAGPGVLQCPVSPLDQNRSQDPLTDPIGGIHQTPEGNAGLGTNPQSSH